MKASELARTLRELDLKGYYVFTRADMEKIFSAEGKETIASGLARHVKAGALIRACKGVCVNPNSRHLGPRTIEDVAQALRSGELNYASLESVLSQHAVISQIMVDRITVMTTGTKGEYKTPFGVIEFTHTKRSLADILKRSFFEKGMPMRRATKKGAYQDLLRVGRNIHLVDIEELQED